jgi:signal transduction histidine kinase/CheY-like chemotaxis protein
MRMRPCIYAALLFFAFATRVAHASVWSDPRAGRPALEYWTEADYNASEGNHVVVRDRRGRVYAGNGGVLMFDGRSWGKIDVGRAYGTRCLEVDEEDRIWVGAIDEIGYLDNPDEGARRYVSLRRFVPEGVTISDVWGVHRLNGRTLFVLQDGLLLWNGDRFRHIPLRADGVRLFSFPFRGGIGISQRGHGFWRWDGGTELERIDLGGAERESIAFIVPLADGSELLDPGKRLMRLRDGTLERVTTDAATVLENDAAVTMAMPLPGGGVCVVSHNRGVVMLDADLRVARVLDRSAGLPGLNCNRVFLDVHGSLWIATNVAIVRLDASARTSVFDAVNGLDAGRVNRVVTLGDEVLALASEGGQRLSIARDLAPGSGPRFMAMPELESSMLDAVQEPDGGLLVGSFRRIIRWRDGEAESVFVCKTQGDRIVPWRDGLYVVADGDEVHLLRAGPRLEFVRTLVPRLPEAVADIAIDAHDRLWIALSKHGLHAFDLSEPEPRNLASGLQPHPDFSTPPNEARFFVLDDVVHVFNERSVHRLSVDGDEVVATEVYSGVGLQAAERSGTRELWAVASSAGVQPRLVRLSIDPDGPGLHVFRSEGLGTIGRAWSVTREDTTDELWIGGSRGAMRANRRNLAAAAPLAAPALLEIAWVHGGEERRLRSVSSDGELPFHAEAVLRFRIRDGLDILNHGDGLESRLVGLETRWNDTPGPREFTGLREGRYRFEARAIGLGGERGPVRSVAFVIQPPWHRSLWAYTAYVAAFAALVFGAIQLRLRRIARLNAELEGLVNTRTEELTRAVAARSAFLATMGHEIRNPLNGVIGLVGILRERTTDAERRSYVDRIANCAQQLAAAVDDVLEFARIDAGRVPVRLRPFALREPVDSAIDIFRASDAGVDIRLEFSGLDDPEARIVADPDRIRQVLVNYLANAVKFGAGGAVDVVGQVRDGALTFGVTDRGPGIPKDEQARLFVRFNRGTLAYKTDIPGTGLGLAACKAYAEAMGGEVWVESELGRGSTFYLRLPYRPATEANSVPTVVAPDIMVGRVALVVDDHEFNRIVLVDLLGRMGTRALSAGDVPEARRVFEDEMPDIVFVDFDLPGSSGADLARWIRADARGGRDVPIVATSAFEVEEIRRRCADAGMDGFIAKPVTPQKVAEVMSRIETLRLGGTNCVQTAPQPSPRGGFLDLLSDGDPKRRKQLERDAWREVLAESMETFRAVRAGNYEVAAQRSHRLVSSALMLALREVVAAARELTEAARIDDRIRTSLAADRLRLALDAARSQRKD